MFTRIMKERTESIEPDFLFDGFRLECINSSNAIFFVWKTGIFMFGIFLNKFQGVTERLECSLIGSDLWN